MAKLGRPPKQTVDWFPHFVASGKTKFVLRSRFGIAGPGAWYALLELLCRTPGHAYSCEKAADWEFLQAEIGFTGGEIQEFFNLLVNLEAIDTELWAKKIIWCQHLVDEISKVYKDRGAEIPIKPGEKSLSPPEMPLSPPDNRGQDKTLHYKTRHYITRQDITVCLSSDDVLEFTLSRKMIVDADEVAAACRKFTPNWVKEAVEIAANKGKNWGYVVAVLEKSQKEHHSPGHARAQPKGDDPDKYFAGPYGHLVNS